MAAVYRQYARQVVDQAIVHLQQNSESVQLRGGPQVDPPHRASAWQEGGIVEKLTPQSGDEKHSLKDMQLEDVTSSDELTSLLDAETRYLPINSELTMSPLKPFHFGTSPTALPQESSPTGTHPEDVPERDTSSSSILPSSGDSQHHQESRYMQYENRPIKPLNQNRRIAANFAFSPKMQAIKPQPSNSRPQPHCSRWLAREPVSTEVTLNDSSNGSSSVSSSSVTSELKLLKDILQSKRTKRSGVRRSHSAHVHSDANKEQVVSSVSSSLYKSEYSPDKYTSGRRATRSRGSGGSKEYSGERRRDSGSGSSRRARDDTDVVSGVVSEAETLAATKLQAFWRGFRARHKDPAVLRLKQELRDRRAEAHIRHLTEELTRQRRLYEEEKQLRHLQMDALKYLWQEVQSLQTWKSEVLCSREELINHKHLAEEVKSSRSTAEATTALEGRNSQGRQQSSQLSVDASQQSSQLSVDTSQQVHLSRKESELETTCQSLQKQVSQLQEVLTSISNYVLQGGVISADHDDTGGSCDIRLSIDTEDQLHTADPGDTSAEPQPGSSRCSLSPSSPTRTPAPGIPTPPENLRIFQRTATSGVLQWQASVIHSSSGRLSNKPVIGYRVYANGCAKGMVAATQRKALIEGLSRTNTYRLTVRAVAALGDSADSNVVIVHAEEDESGDTPKSPPPDNDDDSPDTRHGKHPDDSNGDSPPGGGPSGGDTEPPGGSAGGSRRSSRGSNAGSVTHEDGTTCLHGSSGSLDILECQSSPSGAPHSSTANSRPQAELGCDVDSGCWTSPVSSEKHSQVSPVFAPQHKDERRSRVSQSPDRQQRHFETKQKFATDDQKSTLVVDEERVGSSTLLSSSPRIQEALIKRLEVGRDKGMLVEMKMAAKMHKRKTGPDVSLPLKAVRNNADSDTKSLDKTDITTYIDSMVSQAEDVKDIAHDVADTVHSRIPVYNCKRSPSKVTDTDTQLSNREATTKEDRGVSKEHSSDGRKHVHRKASVKHRSLQCKRDGSSDRETDGVERRRGSVGSRSSSHSRRSSVDSMTGGTGDRVAKNDSEDSMSGHDSLQNSPSSRQRKDSSSDSATLGRRTLGQNPQQKHQKTARRDGKMSTEVSPSTTQTLDDSELENVLLEAPAPVAPPTVSSRRRRTSGSPMRPADKVAVSDRLREDGSIRRSVTTDSRQKHHGDHATGDSDTRRSPAVKRLECSGVRCSDGLPTEHSRLPLQRQSSTRRSAREPHRKVRTAPTEKRSCSVGAVNGQPEAGSTAGDRLTQKPPVLKTPSRDVIGSKPTRRRAYSEHSSPARSLERRQGSSPSRGSSAEVATPPKAVRTHRRSRSDMSAIPVPAKKHPDSSTTPKDWKPVPPSTPKQGVSSPRIRRSSSFSKATRGKGETEGQYTLRQCVSLEMLKAVKSQEAAAAAAAAAAGDSNHDITLSSTSSSDSSTTIGGKPGSSPSPNTATEQPPASVEMGSAHTRPGLAKANSSKVAGVATSSTRPASERVTPKERRINLGTKAADLFAKLQQRLSANKS